MFHTLETTWDHSARRRWTTLASFTVQALGLSLLLLISPLSVQGPPQLWTRYSEGPFLAPPQAPPRPSPPTPPGTRRPMSSSDVGGERIFQPPVVPNGTRPAAEAATPAAPDLSGIGVRGGTGERRNAGFGSPGDSVAIMPPPPPVAAHPLRISHWAEGNVIYRVQPAYPQLARQARIQGSVQLRAVISKAGTIVNLSVLSGHAMLVTAAVEAVKQWRYRPYLLNGEPIEVETEITVNFVLAAN